MMPATGWYDSIMWSTGNTTDQSIFVSAPGTYEVVGTIGLCSVLGTVTVDPAPIIRIDAILITNVVCGGPTNIGAAQSVVSGGCPGYTYTWTPVLHPLLP